MAKDIEVPVVHRAQDTLRLRLAAESEARMDRADGVVELLEKSVGVIERAVRQDVDLARFQNAKAPQAPVHLVDKADLLPKVLDGHAARDLQALRMIADSDIVITQFARGLGHVLDRIAAVAGNCMRMQIAAYIGACDEIRKLAGLRLPDLVATLAQFRLDKG